MNGKRWEIKNWISLFNVILRKLHSFFQTLDEDEFVAFYYNLLERPEIDKLFATYTKESPGKMSPNALLQFLQNEQKDGATVIEECQEIIKYVLNMQVYSSANIVRRNFEPSEDKTHFSSQGFMHFLTFSDMQVKVKGW